MDVLLMKATDIILQFAIVVLAHTARLLSSHSSFFEVK